MKKNNDKKIDKEKELERIMNDPESRKTKKIFDDNLKTITDAIGDGIPIRLMCSTLGISKTTYYTWIKFYEPLQKAADEGELKFYKTCSKSLNRLVSHRKSKTKEVKTGDSGDSVKIITRDKEPDLAAIKYSMSIRERSRREEEKNRAAVISEDDLRELTDEEILNIIEEIEKGIEGIESKLKEVKKDGRR